MKSFKRILVPVDFSSASEDALATALDLAARLGAEVEVIHTWTRIPGLTAGLGADVIRSLASTATANMKKLLARTKIPAGVELTSRVVEGEARWVIVEMSKHVDMVIMGTHGRSGLERMILGSTAERVVREAACPVLTVRNPDIAAEMEQVGVPSDKVIRAMVDDGEKLRAVLGALIETGISSDEISVVMSEDTHEADFSALDKTKSTAGAATGGIMAGTVGGILGGLAGMGAVVTTGGLALFVLGPALGLAAVGAGVGGLLGKTVPDDRAMVLKAQIAEGNRLIAVHAKDRNNEAAAMAVLKAHGAEFLDF